MKKIFFCIPVLGLFNAAIAEEYKQPEINYKSPVLEKTDVKVAGADSAFKVEGAVTVDREIASEKKKMPEEKDREPSSQYEKEKHPEEPPKLKSWEWKKDH